MRIRPLVLALALSAPLAATGSSLTGDARGALWPDAPDRVKSDLESKDVSRRRLAAADLANVPRKEALPLLKIALADSDIDVRLTAANVAARFKMTEASDLVLPWLTDPSPLLREAACEFFAKVPDTRVVKVLARSLGDSDARGRLAAGRALGASGSTEAVAPLLARLDDSNSKVRLSVARALGRLGDKRAVTPLVSKVQDEASEVRQAVVRTLGELGDPKASPALVIALRDQALEVRLEALSALARLRASDAVASIAPLASDASKKGGAADVRRAALAALGRIGTLAAIDAIVKTFGTFEDEKAGVGTSPAREAAVAAGATAVPVLTAIVDGTTSATPAAVASASWAIGEIAPTTGGATITKAIRTGAIPLAIGLHALASLRDPAQLPVCLEHVASPDKAVRTEALTATTRLLDPEKPDGRAVEPLLASLDVAQTGDDRAEIAALLGRTGAARVAPVLIGLTGAKDERLRLAAIDALGTLGAPAAGKALLGLLDDPSAVVRLRAAIAVGRSGGADVMGEAIARFHAAQVDRLAVVLAVSGLLERHGDAIAIKASADALATLGAERDLLLVGIGRAKAGGTQQLAAFLSTQGDVDGRRAIAVGLGAAGVAAIGPLVTLAADSDATVRAEAAWSLGAVGTAAELPLLAKLTRDPAPAVAANAAAAVGRVVSRATTNALTKELPKDLCGALDDDRPYVRANALASLRVSASLAVCDEAKERKLLAEDPNDVVRASAARLLAARAAASGDEKALALATKARTALDRCALSDPSGAVASLCREALGAAVTIAAGRESLVIFVAPDDGGAPQPRTPFAIERPDGWLHVGTADRRGAIVELLLGRGPVRLRVATPQALSATTG